MTDRKWSELVWQKAAPIYEAILRLPFVAELADGTLSHERFLFYIGQDSLYIDNYSRVLAHIASRLPLKTQTEDFLRFAADGIAVEKALHESYLGGAPDPSVRPTPTCLLYMAYETAKGLEPVEVEAASVLPCFWVYKRVGEEIMRRTSADNPYRQWIETYGDETFEKSTLRAIEICDELAASATDSIRRAMTEAFLDATRMEWLFWNSAYNLEKWKI